MKYPKSWDADNKVGVSTTYHEGDGTRICFCLYVSKPGTPNHDRRVIARLTRDQAFGVYQILGSHLKAVQK